MYVSILFTFFSFTNPSSAIPKVDLLIQCPSFFSHGSTDFPATDMLPRQPQKTMHTLMSFRLSNMMHHLQQNKTEEVTSSYGCIVLDGWDLNPQCPPESRYEFPWNTMVQFLKASALHWFHLTWCRKFQLCNWHIGIWFASEGMKLALSFKDNNSLDLFVHIYNKYVFDYWGRCIM